jgi:hypothetical protein
MSNVLENLINVAYPMNQPAAKSNVPLYMPLKLGFVGNTLSGKTTLSQKLAQKYNLILINPQQIINEAFELNK